MPRTLLEKLERPSALVVDADDDRRGAARPVNLPGDDLLAPVGDVGAITGQGGGQDVALAVVEGPGSLAGVACHLPQLAPSGARPGSGCAVDRGDVLDHRHRLDRGDPEVFAAEVPQVGLVDVPWPGRVLAGGVLDRQREVPAGEVDEVARDALGWCGGRDVGVHPPDVGTPNSSVTRVCRRSRVRGDSSRSWRSWVGSSVLSAEQRAVGPRQRGAWGCVGAARRPRVGAPGSRHPWLRRIGRAAPASSARG